MALPKELDLRIFRPETWGRLRPTWSGWVRRFSDQIGKHKVFGQAAEMAYFFLFSIFPLLLVLTSVLGIVAEGENIRRDLLRYFARVMPPSAFELVTQALDEISAAADGGKISIGIIVTIVSASGGMVAIIEALNTAYAVREARPWWRRRIVAVVLTLALASFTIVALAIVLYGNQLGQFLASYFGLEAIFESIWPVFQWLLVVGFVLSAFVIVYRFAPNMRNQRWRWVVPGAGVALVLWLLASFGLRLYLHFFNTYDKVYGSLGAVMILMLWFYLFSVAILIGGEVNSMIENAAARGGDPTAKRSGEKSPLGS